MAELKFFQEIINKSLESLEISEHPAELYQPIAYTIENGGKRIRPALVMAGYGMFGKGHPQDVAELSVAVEVFHNFTLLHDDLMDRSSIRRNKPTVHVKWNDNIAILSGDAMMIVAYQYLFKKTWQNHQKIVALFNKTALEVCEGQQMDMNFENLDLVDEDEYIKMIGLKTSVLIAASLKMGALAAGAADDEADKLYAYGKNLGIAFQLQDDLLDVYGDEHLFGKARANDIVSNKKTILFVTAIQEANKADKELLLKLYSDKQQMENDQKINQVIGLFESLGVREKVEKKIDSYYATAKNYFQQLDVQEQNKMPLKKIFEYLAKRSL